MLRAAATAAEQVSSKCEGAISLVRRGWIPGYQDSKLASSWNGRDFGRNPEKKKDYVQCPPIHTATSLSI